MGLLNYKPIRRSGWKFLKISVRKRNMYLFKFMHSKRNLSQFKTFEAKKEKSFRQLKEKGASFSSAFAFCPNPSVVHFCQYFNRIQTKSVRTFIGGGYRGKIGKFCKQEIDFGSKNSLSSIFYTENH